MKLLGSIFVTILFLSSGFYLYTLGLFKQMYLYWLIGIIGISFGMYNMIYLYKLLKEVLK